MAIPPPRSEPPRIADDVRWMPAGRASDWAPDSGRLVQIGPRRIGIYFHGDAWYALKDICPHAGISLAKGPVREGTVMCIGHGWTFSLRSGDLVRGGAGNFSVATYPVRVVDGEVQIGV